MGILEQIGLFESEKKEFKLYVNMDSVLTDFYKAFEDLGKQINYGMKPEKFEEKYGTGAFWTAIAKGKVEFWSNMDWMEDGRKLWNYVKKYNPTILTKPARSKYSKEGKQIWIDRELGKKTNVIMTRNSKSEYADANSILIDDQEKNIMEWINGDGIGIIHQSADKTIEELKKYGL